MQTRVPATPRFHPVTSTAAMLRWNPSAVIAAGLTYAVLWGIYGVFSPSRDFIPWLVLGIIEVSCVLALFLTGLAALTVMDDGRPPNFLECIGIMWSKLESANRVNFLASGAELRLALTVVGLPKAANLLVRWFFQAHAVVEAHSGEEALEYSSSLFDGRWWPTYRKMLAIWAVALVPICMVGVLQLTAGLSFGVIVMLRVPALTFGFTYHLCAITALYNQLKRTRVELAAMTAKA